jgi:hypothetical protein
MIAGITAFAGHRLLARGEITLVTRAAHAEADVQPLIFDDATGRPVEIDLRGTISEVLARLPPEERPARTRGRPKLGVTAREVTLLPRHWEWLGSQPGGASAALRRLVDQARRDNIGSDAARRAQDVTYRVMTALAGDLPGYEEATRALFAGDHARLDEVITQWPGDVADYIRRLSGKVDAPW